MQTKAPSFFSFKQIAQPFLVLLRVLPLPTRMLLSPSSIYLPRSKTNLCVIFLLGFYSLRLAFEHMHVGCHLQPGTKEHGILMVVALIEAIDSSVDRSENRWDVGVGCAASAGAS